MAVPADRAHEAPAAAALRERYLSALLAGDTRAARGVIDAAVEAGASVRDIYLDMLQPALYEVGVRWSRAEIGVAQEHLATAATQSLMAELAARLSGGAPARGREVVVACAEDELHSVGLRMVADFLEADGWTVTWTGAMTPAAGLLEVARRADAVAISAALPERISLVTRTVAALRELPRPPYVLVGGQAFAGSSERALGTGADAYAADAQEAVRVLDVAFPA